ncbi:MAG: serine/threonine protein kinase [Deltaproteobacteria bacterium]|nr:serine/threonine protein kinase [Deltaproteobacteria bacterium]
MAEKMKIKRYDVVEQQAGEETINYKAWDPLTQKRITIKEPLPELLSRPSFLESFLAEGNRLRAINDEHVAKFYEMIPPAEVGGKCYLVTEYVGKSVEDLIHHGVVDIETGKEILKDALLGLKVIHQSGLVHGNIRPSSIMITPEGKAKITDFRISRLEEGGGFFSAGSEKYLPHEVLAGDGQIGPWSDLYSLGCVAYEMFAGSYQFDSQFSAVSGKESRYRDWHCDLSARAKSLKEIDYKIAEDVSDFVARLMEKTIDRRFRNGDHALRNLVGEEAPEEEASEAEKEKKVAPQPQVSAEQAGEMKTQAMFQVGLGPAEKAAPSSEEAVDRTRRKAPSREQAPARRTAAQAPARSTFLRDSLIILGVAIVGIILVLLIIKFV